MNLVIWKSPDDEIRIVQAEGGALWVESGTGVDRTGIQRW